MSGIQLKRVNHSMLDEYVKRILQARVYELAEKTPLEKANRLSQRLSNHIWLKREDLQSVFSFKLRGAYNKIVHLTAEQQAKGIIAASAGNHAQGVAMSAHKLGLQAVIVMPKTTPRIKIEAVASWDAEVVLHGNTYDDAYARSMKIVAARGLTYIHPYDDPDVIAGQGTIGKEIIDEYGDQIHAIFIPVGGGGLIAGISAYIKTLYPHIKIIGVEPDDAPSMYEALKANERVLLDQVGIFADGVAVRQVGEETFRIARQTVDEVILVSTDEL